MLRITSSKCKTAQFFEGTYQGNPMGNPAQCEGCGMTYEQARGQLASCEYCEAEGLNNVYCENCHDSHTREHFTAINQQPEPMLAPFPR